MPPCTMHSAENSLPLAGVVVAVPFDLEAEALVSLEFGLPAEALQLLGHVEGMPVFAYLFRTQVRRPCHSCMLYSSLCGAWQQRA